MRRIGDVFEMESSNVIASSALIVQSFMHSTARDGFPRIASTKSGMTPSVTVFPSSTSVVMPLTTTVQCRLALGSRNIVARPVPAKHLG